jgi:F-type H+-transporting ATPase subunit c
MMNRIRKLATVSATVALATVGASTLAFAEEAAAGAAASTSGMIALSSALAIALSAFGAALGQGKAVAKAMESIGRNPNSADRIQTPMIIGLALMEALAIYGLIIAFILSGKF